MNGFPGRMARRWWLMLVLGILIGLGVGLPVGGKLMPDRLVGTAGEEPRKVQFSVGQEFSLDVFWGWRDGSEYEVRYFSKPEDIIELLSPLGPPFKFRAKKPGVQMVVVTNRSQTHLGPYIVRVTP